MLRDLIRTLRMRHFIKKERKETGKCQNCNKVKKCDDWCWGPSIHTILWLGIKHPRPKVWKFLRHALRQNLKWSGVEKWHRYE